MPSLALGSGLEHLLKMTESMRSRNYSGVFIYRQQDQMETMKIIHQGGDNDVYERIFTLTGEPREIIRHDTVITSIWPEQELVIVGHDRPQRFFPKIDPANAADLIAYYDFIVQPKTERVAGRQAIILDIIPKDTFRYQRRFWIDQDTSLLLRADLSDTQNPLEQIIFTELQEHQKISAELLQPELSIDGFQQRVLGESHSFKPDSSIWQQDILPPGFYLQSSQQRFNPKLAANVEHFLFSDGLASISVFIRPYQKNDKVLEGFRKRGALSTYGAVKGQHHIMIVGEVPESTVTMLAAAIRIP